MPPHNITPIIGSTHIAVNRDYVDFALHDPRSMDFLEWLEDTVFAEETFFPSLHYNLHLGIPGSFLGKLYHQKRTALWSTSETPCEWSFAGVIL